MKRRHFLSAVVPLGTTLVSMAAGSEIIDGDMFPNIPPYLKKGDIVGISCPAGFISVAEIDPAVKRLKEWGFEVKIGNTVGKKDFTLGGTDAERLKDLQQMLDTKNIKAILCGRGGYGSVRIIDQLDFTKFRSYPKWIIGFSDITLLHCHLNRNYGIASLHSKMCNSFPEEWNKAEPIQVETINSIYTCLTGGKINYPVTPNTKNRTGKGTGILIGGNLKTIESLAGSKSDLLTNDKILFVEDTGEYLYSIDRMFWSLKRSNKLSKLKGLIIGGFKIKKDDEGEEFGKTLEEIVLEKVSEYKYPVCFDFPVGHQKNNFALKCGVIHELDVRGDRCSLKSF